MLNKLKKTMYFFHYAGMQFCFMKSKYAAKSHEIRDTVLVSIHTSMIKSTNGVQKCASNTLHERRYHIRLRSNQIDKCFQSG